MKKLELVPAKEEKEMLEQKKVADVIYLDEKELKLYNLLASNSADSSDWLSLEDIKSNLNLKSIPAAKKLVTALSKEEGINLNHATQDVDGKKKTNYGLAPETLEVLVKRQTKSEGKKETNGIAYSALYLAEPGFGTKAFDHEYTMKGLGLLLQTNKLASGIQEVIIQGGVIPHVPPYSSKSYVNDLRFLGWVKRKDDEYAFSEELLEEKISNPFEQEFYEKHVNNAERRKIIDLTDAFSVAEEQLKILMDSINEDAGLRIQLGEEDRKNINPLKKDNHAIV